MPRKLSPIAPDWWDYTTLDDDIIQAAARLTAEQMLKLSLPGFKIVFYDTFEEFYLAEALEYINAWKQSSEDNPTGICGPIGPTEQLPLVARLVNELNLKVRSAHFWGVDEWFHDGREVPATHPLSFERADRELCFNRIRPELRMEKRSTHPGGIPQAAHPRGRFAPVDDSAERAHFRGGECRAGADESHQRRSGGNLESGESIHLARRPARQPVRPAVDHLDDRDSHRGYVRADVAARRPSERAVQFLS